VQPTNDHRDDQQLIVVVDDDVAMLRALERGLRVRGYHTAGFSEVTAFLSSASLHGTTCLVLDVDLKPVSGIDVAFRLKRLGYLLPTVFITGADSLITRRAAIRAGCIGYLTKPFPLEALVASIERNLEIDEGATEY
jgi:FixJ family two-component response regulator